MYFFNLYFKILDTVKFKIAAVMRCINIVKTMLYAVSLAVAEFPVIRLS